ncbi:uncharacterized protein LOC131293775 [Anopheles ziemanni]|uniref:uncharacterized protein LOC131264557 n=1 Tax=Anopheles coustani TaxID=139045 RepID=UPI00265A0EF3|nr:uncharacterized protein LOC131264557 [Anopheles coustani]XP_058177817.1 uncharacterized protein LOC131293775 [Anopheles ziemanni]
MVDVRIDEEKLILLVQERRHLWDNKDSNYKNKYVTSKAWNAIGAELKVHEYPIEYLDESLEEIVEEEAPQPIKTPHKTIPTQKKRSDAVILEELVALEKERHEMDKQEKSANYYFMLSLVPLLDSLSEEDQMDAREEILSFTNRIVREKKQNELI